MAQTKEEKATYMRAYRIEHKEEIAAYMRIYYSEHKDGMTAYAHTYDATHKKERRGYLDEHQEERRALLRAYREAHRANFAERRRRRDALKRGAGRSGPIDIVAIKQRDRMLCCICGKRVADKDFSLDHTIPLSLGGPHTQENLRVAHRRCNSKRGAGRLPVQMILV